jgi:hypothetical protein
MTALENNLPIKPKRTGDIAITRSSRRHQATEQLIGYDKEGRAGARVSDLWLSGSVNPCASLHYSQNWSTEEFFRESEQTVDKVRIWLDRDTDSKVLSKVHGWILTRRETRRVSVNGGWFRVEELGV